MAPIDLDYRCQTHGITRRQLAGLLGRDYQTISKWARDPLSQPVWLADWLEMVDMALICGKTPPLLPKRLVDIRALLYPSRTAELAASKRRRGPNGCRAEMLAKRAAARKRRQRRQASQKITHHDTSKL